MTSRSFRDRNRAINYGPDFWRMLNEVQTILGTTKNTLWPGFENTGQAVFGYGAGDLTPRDETTARNLEDEWLPLALAATEINAYRNVASTNNHFTAGDNASYSFTDGADDDEVFSLGLWCVPEDVATVALIAKYGSTANLEEYAFRIDASSNLQLELHDASASASFIGLGTDAIVANRMQFLVVTYDGAQAAPVMNFYINGQPDGANPVTAAETGTYVGMENTAAALLIMAEDAIATPANEFTGYEAMPFVTGKELDAAEVLQLYELTRTMVGA